MHQTEFRCLFFYMQSGTLPSFTFLNGNFSYCILSEWWWWCFKILSLKEWAILISVEKERLDIWTRQEKKTNKNYYFINFFFSSWCSWFVVVSTRTRTLHLDLRIFFYLHNDFVERDFSSVFSIYKNKTESREQKFDYSQGTAAPEY